VSLALDLSETLARLVHLIALCVAPGFLSPDPAPDGGAHGVIAALVLIVSLWAAARFARKMNTRLGRLAAGSWWVVFAVGLGALLWFRGEHAPLGAAVPFVAPVVWASLALAAAAAGDRLLKQDLRWRALVPATLVVLIGAGLVGSAWSLLRSHERMWTRALDLEPAHERAVTVLAAHLSNRRHHDQALGLAERCIAKDRASCTCHALRIEAELRLRQFALGLDHARGIVELCAQEPRVHASLAQALVLTGANDAAMAAVSRALALVSSTGEPMPPSVHYAHALVLDGLGRRPEAAREAELAVATGGGRDARMLAAAIAIAAADLDSASRWVAEQLTVDPADPDALYNRALIADKKNDFNKAREGYLATLKLEPGYAAARYNLALLTWRYGVREEAKSHVRRFVEAYPGDPRAAQLLATIGTTAP
jgi:tetratricopeptide (TPR) repeat protein